MSSRRETAPPRKRARSTGATPIEELPRHPNRPVAVGTGFVALDIVVKLGHEGMPRTWAGGTCGNVLALLAYLGWRSFPVSSLGTDAGGDRVVEDLTRFGVSPRFIKRDPERRTPIVVEKIRAVPGGTPRSRFAWTCPACGAWLPSYQPVLAKVAQAVAESMPDPAVFFFDRVSRGALDMAGAAADRGALVVFEPSGVRDERLFQQALRLSHVLKYSHERLTGVGDGLNGAGPLLEVETLGADGLRYRRRERSRTKGWRLMDAFSVGEVKDTVGAGDWCTAGMVHMLGVSGAAGLTDATDDDVEQALRIGQALASLACGYEGARGGMYAMNKRQLRSAIARILAGGAPVSRAERGDGGDREFWKAMCPACSGGRGERLAER